MDVIAIIQSSLLTPLILFFILGIIATRIKSDLKIPDAISEFLPIYLLAVIGLHGGLEMRKMGFDNMIIPILVAVGLSVAMTMNHYQILKRLGKFNIFDSYAIAAAYGSVGATSFSVGLSFLKTQNQQSEGFMAVILAVLEPVSLILCVFLVNMSITKNQKKLQHYETKQLDVKQIPTDDSIAVEIGEMHDEVSLKQVLQNTIAGKAIVILLGAIIIGYIIGESGFQSIKLGFEDMFFPALVIFLIEMGIITGQKLGDVKKAGKFLIIFSVVVPTFNGIIGVVVSTYIGLSIGGSVLLGLLFASASFIAAPSVLRTAIRKANPGLYITSALGITFPFNMIVLLPVMFILSTILHNPETLDLSSYFVEGLK
ncbi:Putative permease [Candidatus Nitrosarchaeum limnium SFB1]|jgi:hypothetical protein|uniref:Putative permease n=1 Tax=Candidatus Nitrosarchaeum limnium SFB1 TaxID=886738 RepID=F3KKU7_9ARCH|nr:Putative permease [Candidatus Nitrosarchaeum limnium SFB1]